MAATSDALSPDAPTRLGPGSVVEPPDAVRALLWQGLGEFARAITDEADPKSALDVLTATASGLLTAAGACVTAEDGEPLAHTPAALPELAVLDTVQHRSEAGLGVTAIRSGDVLAIEDLAATEAQWPEFADAARDLEMRAVLAAAVGLEDGRQAALSVYVRSARPWSADDKGVVDVISSVVTSTISSAGRLRSQARVVSQLQHALDSRVLIEQAKGVLAATEHIQVDDAFELMRRHARRRGISLREVAHAVIELGFRPPGASRLDQQGPSLVASWPAS